MSVRTPQMPVPTVAQSQRMPLPVYVPLSQVSFGPNEIVMPHAVPQMPSPTGIVGNMIETYNRISDYPAVQQVFAAPRVMTRF